MVGHRAPSLPKEGQGRAARASCSTLSTGTDVRPAEGTPGLAARTLCCPIKSTTQDLCRSQATDISLRSFHLVRLEARRAPGVRANETSHTAEPLPLNTHSETGMGETQNQMAQRAGKGQRGGHGNATVTLETGAPVADLGFYLYREQPP